MPRAHRQFLSPKPLVVALLVAAGATRLAAQFLPWAAAGDDEASPFGLRMEYVKLDVEGQNSTYRIVGGTTRDWNQVTLMPAVGVKWDYYVYNPYLLKYSVVFEPGYYWQRGNAAGQPMLTREWMLNGRALAAFLAAKPYATTFSLGRSHQQVQSDFFTAQTVDQQTWSVHSGYVAGAVPVTVGVEHSHEDRDSGNQVFVTDQLRVTFHAVNDRKNQDSTVLDYQYNRYDNRSSSGAASYDSESSSHHALVTDREIFHDASLYSSLNLNTLETAGASATSVNAATNYNRDLAPNLHTTATYTLGASSGSGYHTVQHYVIAALNHQLYESLGSHLDVHGLEADSRSSGATLDSTTYGVTGTFTYTKRLGQWGSLSANTSESFDLTDQRSAGGELVIPSESYTIPAAGPMIIRLRSPRVVSITSITKNNVPLDPDEWRALVGSDPWQVQFLGGGAHAVTSGDTVVITYIVQPNPTGTYTTTNFVGGFMVRFWHDQLGVRLNYQSTTNHTSTSGFVLQDLTQYQVGTDANWHGLRGDASYTHVRSTLYSFQNRSLSESYSVPFSSSSTLGLTFNQQWINYPAGSGDSAQRAEDLSYYNYLLHYDWHPGGGLSVHVEGGLQQQRGTLEDQNLLAARVHLAWVRGKLEVHCGFDHENLEYVNDVYGRNFVFLRMRRNF